MPPLNQSGNDDPYELLYEALWNRGNDGDQRAKLTFADMVAHTTRAVPSSPTSSSDAEVQMTAAEIWLDHIDPHLDFPDRRTSLYVRDEYWAIMQEIDRLDAEWSNGILERKDSRSNKNTLVIAGQPGIGKSCLLHALLVRRLLSGKPVIWQSRNRLLYYFTPDGCERHTHPFNTLTIPRAWVFAEDQRCPPWALIDVGITLTEPAEELREVGATAFIIQTGLVTDRRAPWLKNKNWKQRLLTPCTWQETALIAKYHCGTVPPNLATVGASFLKTGANLYFNLEEDDEVLLQ